MGLVEHLKLSNVVLVGHSLGSVIALFAALKTQKISPDKVSGIVLLAGSLDPENLPLFLRLLRSPIFGWLVMKLSSASFRTRLVLKKAFYDHEKVTDSLVELYAKYQRIPGTDYALLKTAEQMIPQDSSQLRQELRTLQIPVLNIAGEHDEIISRASTEEVCRVLPRCSLVVVEGVGHVPHEEAPQKIVSVLKDFMAGTIDSPPFPLSRYNSLTQSMGTGMGSAIRRQILAAAV
jgi:pimeloyl-ACP methyl ester carboxylesterase